MATEAQNLIREIEKFLARHAMAESRFGLHAVNDGKLLSRLRDNKSVTLRTLDRIRAFMRSVEGERDAA